MGIGFEIFNSSGDKEFPNENLILNFKYKTNDIQSVQPLENDVFFFKAPQGTEDPNATIEYFVFTIDNHSKSSSYGLETFDSEGKRNFLASKNLREVLGIYFLPNSIYHTSVKTFTVNNLPTGDYALHIPSTHDFYDTFSYYSYNQFNVHDYRTTSNGFSVTVSDGYSILGMRWGVPDTNFSSISQSPIMVIDVSGL